MCEIDFREFVNLNEWPFRNGLVLSGSEDKGLSASAESVGGNAIPCEDHREGHHHPQD